MVLNGGDWFGKKKEPSNGGKKSIEYRNERKFKRGWSAVLRSCVFHFVYGSVGVWGYRRGCAFVVVGLCRLGGVSAVCLWLVRVLDGLDGQVELL